MNGRKETAGEGSRLSLTGFMAAIIAVCAVSLFPAPSIAGPAGEVRQITAAPQRPTTFAVSGDGHVAWLEAGSGAPMMRAPGGEVSPIALPARARAVAGDEKGQILVLAGEAQTGYKVYFHRDGRRIRTVDLKPAAPIDSPVDMASGNEIVWVLQAKPPLAALFGSDGAELGRQDLAGVAAAPFSIAVDHAGRAFVTDPTAQAVIELTPYGQFKKVHALTGSGFTRPAGIAASFSDRLWLSDTVTGEVAPFRETPSGLVRDETRQAIKVDDPVKLSVTAGELWLLQGWRGGISRVRIE